MCNIERYQSTQRLSRVVVHNGIIYIAGVTASDTTEEIVGQTRDVLARIDDYLAMVGSDKAKLLSVQIWLKDIQRDFNSMNTVWEEWMSENSPPTRATCEARLARPELLVEIIATAAR